MGEKASGSKLGLPNPSSSIFAPNHGLDAYRTARVTPPAMATERHKFILDKHLRAIIAL